MIYLFVFMFFSVPCWLEVRHLDAIDVELVRKARNGINNQTISWRTMGRWSCCHRKRILTWNWICWRRMWDIARRPVSIVLRSIEVKLSYLVVSIVERWVCGGGVNFDSECFNTKSMQKREWLNISFKHASGHLIHNLLALTHFESRFRIKTLPPSTAFIRLSTVQTRFLPKVR